MASSGRLTNNQVDSIVKLAVTDATQAEERAVEAEENACLVAVVAYLTKPAELALAVRLPIRWINRTNKLRVKVRGQYHELSRQTYEGSEDYLIPSFLTSGIPSINDEALADRITKLVERREALVERKSILKIRVRALVRSVPSILRLSQAWPEGEPYWRDYLAEWRSGRQVPVVKVDEVNKLLGIPKEQAA